MKKSQRALLIMVVVGTIVALGIVISIANTVNYKTLYTNLDSTEAGEVYTKLIEMGIDAKAAPNGTVRVPADQVEDARLKLSSEGYPKSGNIDYDIYGKATSFGMTDTDKVIYETYQLEQNIAKTINKMNKVESSTVLISMAEETQFVLSKANDSGSSASVMLVLKSGDTLTAAEAETIRLLVSAGVKDLKAENVIITDSQMNTYGGGNTASGSVGAVNEQLNLQERVNSQLQQQILNLLTPVFGVNNISAVVYATLNFDQEATESIVLSPPVDDAGNNGIVTSLKETQERIINAQGLPDGVPGQNQNGGGAPIYPEIDGAAQDSVYYQTVREVNQEVNQINQQIQKAQGEIKDISTTVIINGDTEIANVLTDVKTQISTATGIPEEMITVSAMPFQQNIDNATALEEQKAIAEKVEQGRITQQYLMIGVLGGIIAAIIIAFLMAAKKKKKASIAKAQEELANQNRVNLVADEEIDLRNPIEAPEMRQNTVLEQLKAMVKKNPESVAQLLRNWLNEDLRR